jgi:hypothetical protein
MEVGTTKEAMIMFLQACEPVDDGVIRNNVMNANVQKNRFLAAKAKLDLMATKRKQPYRSFPEALRAQVYDSSEAEREG